MVATLRPADEPDALRHSHFFNGRILTAEDLHVDQLAVREQDARLGLGLGAGVIWGLEVAPLKPEGPTQRVQGLRLGAGLALDRRGRPVALGLDHQVILSDTPPPTGAGGAFVPEVGGGAVRASPPEFYILTVASTLETEERAPLSAIGSGGRITGSGPRFDVETTLPQVHRLWPPADLPDDPRLRSRLAHLCLGTAGRLRFPPGRDTLWSRLASLCHLDAFPDDQVPLCLLDWTDGGVRFVDMWAVRRRCRPATGLPWPLADGPDAPAEVEATFEQFQAQLADLQAAAATGGDPPQAVRQFAYLPPVGHLAPPPRGPAPHEFLAGLSLGQVREEGALLPVRVQALWHAAPIDLADPPAIGLYQAADTGDALFLRGDALPPPPADEGGIRAEVVPPAGQPYVPGNLAVYAVGPDDRQHAALAPTGMMFPIVPLPPGTYRVWGRLQGYPAADATAEVGADGRPATVRLRFVKRDPVPAPPASIHADTWGRSGWPAGRLDLVTDRFACAELPASTDGWARLEAPEPVRHWLAGWAAHLATSTDLPADPASAEIRYDPRQPPIGDGSEVHAYACFGQGAAHAPLRLVPDPDRGLLEDDAAPPARGSQGQ